MLRPLLLSLLALLPTMAEALPSPILGAVPGGRYTGDLTEFRAHSRLFIQKMRTTTEAELIDFRLLPYLSRNVDLVPSGIEGIDAILMINLDHRGDKLAYCREHLAKHGLQISRVAAVYGREMPKELFATLGVYWEPWMLQFMGTHYDLQGQHDHAVIGASTESWYSHCFARNPIAIVLSQVSAIYYAFEHGMTRAWIMEDDIEFKQPARNVLKHIAYLDQHFGVDGWDILFTDLDTKNMEGKTIPCSGYILRPDIDCVNNPFQRYQVNQDITQYGSRYGAYSYIINRPGMRKILAFYHTVGIFSPYDAEITMVPGLRFFGLNEDLATHIFIGSDNG